MVEGMHSMLTKYITKITYLVAGILISGALYYHFHLNHKKEAKHHPIFLVTTPWKENLELNKEYVAQIRAIQHIELRSHEKGYLQNIYVDEGQRVRKGQKMFQLMPLLMQAEYDKAKAEYEIARLEYNNTKSLEAKKIVSPNELSLAKAKLTKEEATMNLAKTHKDFALIKAPFDGIMDKFHVRQGSLVDEGELLTTLSDTSQVWVYFNVSESDYLEYIANNQKNEPVPIELVLANGTVYAHPGKIDTIEADFNNETGNISFRASFPNPKGILRHGQTGNVILKEKLSGALVIPQNATFEVLDKKYVYVIDKNNVARSQRIEVTHDVPHLYVVESGLTRKDRILLEGIERVHPNQKVKIRMLDNAEVKKNLTLPVG